MKNHLKIHAISAFVLGFVLCQNIRAGASFPHDRYDEPARYEGTFCQGTNAPEQAVIVLKYDRPVVWKQIRKANHLLDCEAMQIVDALCCGIIQEDHEKYANAQQALSLEAS